nr:helitron helicase-like domain-containing protein [Tanacetum cinerariifolium]
MKTKNKPVKMKMPYDLQMEYTSMHIPKKLDLKFDDSRLSLPTNPVHETSAPSNIDVIKEDESSYNQTNNDDRLTMHTKTQDMLSTTIGNHTATSSLGTFGIQNNSFLKEKYVTNNDIKDPHTCCREKKATDAFRHRTEDVSAEFKRWSQAKCAKTHASEKRVANEFVNNNGQIIFRPSATSRIGHCQKQYATRIHQRISDNQQVAPSKKIPEFKVRLYNVVGTRQYEVPTPEAIRAIIFGDNSTKDNEFDLIVE